MFGNRMENVYWVDYSMNRQNNIRRERESLNGIKELYNLILTYENNEQENAHKLVKQLLEYQKADGSFCVTEKCPTESDSRIHYYYEPTYYGAAALMHVMLSDCGKADKEIEKALNRALPVVMQRELVGYGYDATRQQLDALKIFKDAGLYEWMSRFEESLDTTTRDFCAMIRKIISGYREAVLSGRTFSDWNVDFRNTCNAAAEMLPRLRAGLIQRKVLCILPQSRLNGEERKALPSWTKRLREKY